MPVLELTLSTVPPSYETILDLDRRVREKVLPPSLNLYRSGSADEYTTPSSYIRGRFLSQFRTSSESLRMVEKIDLGHTLSYVIHSPQFLRASHAGLPYKPSS